MNSRLRARSAAFPSGGARGPGCDRRIRPRRFERLAEQLAGLKGRFVLSLNDPPGVREMFGHFDIEAVEATYTVVKGASAKKV